MGKRVLVVSTTPPYPLVGGDRTRIYYTMRLLSKYYTVDLMLITYRTDLDLAILKSFVDRVIVLSVPKVGIYGNALIRCLTNKTMLLRYGFPHIARIVSTIARRYDVVYCYYITTAVYGDLIEPVRIIDFVDAISLHYSEALRWVRGTRRLAYMWDYEKLRRYEAQVLRRFQLGFVSSEVEQRYLRGLVSERECGGDLIVLPTGVKEEMMDGELSVGDYPWVLFVGNLAYYANRDAVTFFVEQVWPIVRASCPHARFVIVGAGSEGMARNLVRLPGVDLIGQVDDVRPYFDCSAVVVAPMRIASGIQTKVLEAMARGKAVIATSAALRGVKEAQNGIHVVAADSPPDIAARIVWLLKDAESRRAIGRAARQLIRAYYTWEALEPSLITPIKNLV